MNIIKLHAFGRHASLALIAFASAACSSTAGDSAGSSALRTDDPNALVTSPVASVSPEPAGLVATRALCERAEMLARERPEEYARAIRAEGLDPAEIDAEAEALRAIGDPSAARARAKAYADLHGAAIERARARLGLAIPAPELQPVGDVHGLMSRPSAYTECTTRIARAPFSLPTADVGNASADANGHLFSRVSGTIAGGGTTSASIIAQSTVPAGESSVRVTARVRLNAGGGAWAGTGLFGYAASGVVLRLGVGGAVCDHDVARSSFIGEDGIPASESEVTCDFPRQIVAGVAPSQLVSATVSLMTWATAGGLASADAHMDADVLSVSFTNCVEPGVMIGASALCTQTAGRHAAAGSLLELGDCVGDPMQRWSLSPSAEIRNPQGLCISNEGGPSGSRFDTLQANTCDGTLRQKFVLMQNKQLISWSTGRCIDTERGGLTIGTLLQGSECTRGLPSPGQRWEIERAP